MTIDELYKIIKQRSQASPEESYTAKLFKKGQDEILKKVGEESIEVILAAAKQGDERLVEEVADLTYHVLTLLVYHDVSLDAIRDELEKRRKPH